MKLEMDYSTINKELLGKLPALVLPPSYRLQNGMGNGCYGDPPGYPTYYTKCVYTAHGNTPGRKGQATLALLGRVVQKNYEQYEDTHKLLHHLWLPLPVDHPRVVAWIRSTYRYLHSCYSIPEVLEYGKPKTLIQSLDFGHKKFVDDPRFSDDWRNKERAAIDAYNKDIDAQWAEIAKPENHRAVQAIQEHYPEHQPDLELINTEFEHNEGDWWETYERRPEPDECPGMTVRWGRGAHGYNGHPLNITWCQVCGWRAEN